QETGGGGDVGAVAAIEGIGAGHSVSGGIDDGEVRGLGTVGEAADRFRWGVGGGSRYGAGGRISGAHGGAGRRMVRIVGGGELFGIARIGEAGYRHGGKVGIGKVSGAVCEDVTHGFGDHMNAFDVVPAFERDVFEHVESFDNGDTAGAGRRRGDDFPEMGFILRAAFVLAAQNFANFGRVVSKIIKSD